MLHVLFILTYILLGHLRGTAGIRTYIYVVIFCGVTELVIFIAACPDPGCAGEGVPGTRLPTTEAGWLHPLQQEVCSGGAVQ